MRLHRLFHTTRKVLTTRYFDIIGSNVVDTKSFTVLQNLNDSVNMLVSTGQDPTSLLKNALSEDGNCKMTHILMVFALLRQADDSNNYFINLLLNKLKLAYGKISM